MLSWPVNCPKESKTGSAGWALALTFLILIGVLLVIEGWNPVVVEEFRLKNYAYFAMAFSFLVELINLRLCKTSEPVRLHNQPHMPADEEPAASADAQA